MSRRCTSSSRRDHARDEPASRGLERRARPGMTLVEAVVAVLIVGVMLAASIGTVGAARKALGSGSERTQGLDLAQALMDEITAQPYDDPNGVSAIPNTGNRSQFNNVGDYAGWVETPPKDKAGVALPGFTGWTRRVAIRYVQPANITTTNATDVGLSELTVRVLRGTREAARLTSMRTRGLPATQACKLANGTCVNLTTADCALRGGTAQGAGSNCWTLPIPEANVRLGLVASWMFEEGSGSTATDDANGHVATLLSGAGWTGSGHTGKGLSLNGTTNYAQTPHAADLSITSSLTLAAWVYPTASTSYRTILHKGTGTTRRNYFLQLNAGKPSFGFYDVSGSLQRFTITSPALASNTWTHLAATYDPNADTVAIYVNGALAQSWSTTRDAASNTDALTIGLSPYGDYWQGRLDDVRIYSRALTAAGVTTLYNGGEP